MSMNPLSRTQRRGVVLILVLAILALIALIGVTFAAFAGQAKTTPETSHSRSWRPSRASAWTDSHSRSSSRGYGIREEVRIN
jgi:Tfp pilus assembly protein PilX